MSRSIADRLRSLDVKSGMVSPASAAVAGAARPAPAGEAASKKPAAPAGGGTGTGAGTAPAAPPATAGAGEGEAGGGKRGRGRPPRHEAPGRQTTIRLSVEEWAALQAQVTRETVERGERRYAVDIIRDAVGEYLARHG
ncbi:hypothetical protein [Marinimicrococcus flavescens]|uniref:Uncharacterized protein n=1 Tax=Marinimicrococcus flavescens TaxID=3031815 RepID=A0AAP3V1I8_9PROT|nr:hypothetical protein [Marinimicrococcus flavescens]